MNLPKLPDFYIDNIIKTALAEDINYIDVTTDLLIDESVQGTAELIAKSNGILSGITIAQRVFTMLDNNTKTTVFFKDGEKINNGDIIAKISGSSASMLKAERTALNILQHMSGIATYTHECVKAVSSTNARITDTRKTLPGLRALQKYAVLCGGGSNHRYNLSSAALIKDNHIDAYGSITKAVETLRERAGHTIMIEVEVRNFDELNEAIQAKADIIMLDNMDYKAMTVGANCVRPLNPRPLLEASGNITLNNIREVAETGIDIISLGALTHSVKAFDISMKWVK
ncbi:MAG: carboxylating nicotinate-nucleotide diphosphorylase [Oscillospiraceae bacterium]|nr:carboxylating nicotinate-nucleotide diphosphorylase [Oscillospiraceae bacterium]